MDISTIDVVVVFYALYGSVGSILGSSALEDFLRGFDGLGWGEVAEMYLHCDQKFIGVSTLLVKI